MSIRRITISVPEPVADRIKEAAGAFPVSAWTTALIEDHLDDRELERRRWPVLTSDVKDLLAIDPTLAVQRI